MLVEIHPRVSVETLEDEFDVLACERLRVDSESGSVFPIFFVDPLLLLLVIAIKRIVDQFIGKQISVNAAGNGGVVPIRFSDFTELPASMDLR